MITKLINRVAGLLILIALTGCSVQVIEPAVVGYVYDEQTKIPLAGVKIERKQELGWQHVATTDEQGKFTIDKLTSISMFPFNFESVHDPLFSTIRISHQGYLTKTIEERARGSFSDIKYPQIDLTPDIHKGNQ